MIFNTTNFYATQCFPKKKRNLSYKFIYQNWKNFENTEDSEFRSSKE